MDRSPEIDAFLPPCPTTCELPWRPARTDRGGRPEAVETIAYSVPAFRYRGRPLVSFSAGRKAAGPCAFYVQSPELMEAHRAAAARRTTPSKGTIHFTPAAPLPAELVTMLVRERMAETDRKGKR